MLCPMSRRDVNTTGDAMLLYFFRGWWRSGLLDFGRVCLCLALLSCIPTWCGRIACRVAMTFDSVSVLSAGDVSTLASEGHNTLTGAKKDIVAKFTSWASASSSSEMG